MVAAKKRKGKVDFSHVAKVVISIKSSVNRQANTPAYIEFNLV